MSVTEHSAPGAPGPDLGDPYDDWGDGPAAYSPGEAPRQVLVCEGSPRTRARLEAAGCSVVAYSGDEISHNRAGGPTCLTRPILRGESGV